MILSSAQIIEAVKRQQSYLRRQKMIAEGKFTSPVGYATLERSTRIYIQNFDPARCGPNSYDVTLAPTLLVYKDDVLDMAKDNPCTQLVIPPDGLLLQPGKLYLGTINEHTESYNCVPWIDGRSSAGRLGFSLHCTAGKGDRNFVGRFTLEITVVQPLFVYPNARVGQITFFDIGDAGIPYAGGYNTREDELAIPVPSKMWKSLY